MLSRRKALRQSYRILKTSLFSPAIIGLLQSCNQKQVISNKLLVLDEDQFLLVKTIADTIIPRTDSPSASDVNVVQFLDLLLIDVFDKTEVQQFLQGLDQLNQECQSITGNSITEISEDQRFSFFEAVDNEIMNEQHTETVPFYYGFKYLIAVIYFSTEEGVKQNLNYLPIPGPYKGSIDYKEGDKLMVGNHM